MIWNHSIQKRAETRMDSMYYIKNQNMVLEKGEYVYIYI